MKNLIFILRLYSYLAPVMVFGQYNPGHSTVEYSGNAEPGLSIKNVSSGLVDASLLSIYNDQNIRLNIGVSSSSNFLFGNSRTYLHSLNNAPLDFYTGGARRLILDNAGRFGINVSPGFTSQFHVRGNSNTSDTVAKVEVTLTELVDVVALSATSTPNGIASNWGIGGVFRGGYRGLRAFTEVGVGVEGNAKTGTGVKGESVTGSGVKGSSTVYGVEGVSDLGTGVRGFSTSGHGVAGSSQQSHGIHGSSSADSTAGVLGIGDYGIWGIGRRAGVNGRSALGHGVVGYAEGGIVGNEKWDFYANGPARDWGTSSSRRWKNNIKNIEDPLVKISKLRGVTYDWDNEHGGGRHDIGFIAEEVGEILPELVTYEENGVDAIALDYTKISALIVEAFNVLRLQQDSELEELRSEVAKLRSRIQN
ncbi:MAG: tail fiber domain-containing protein [Saprospiraceae bacterium]|nr:tail fiber domain-containing protein [Saprospiraceae bacterium]